MVNAVQKFLRKYVFSDGPQEMDLGPGQLRIAVAALLCEMARMDFEIDDEELRTAARSLKDKFEMTDEEADKLVELSRQSAGQHTSYYEFTSLLNRQLSYQQRIELIEQLWKVAFADGTLSAYEDHFVRKIADLIYVTHADFIAAKLRARPA